ncbi:MAG: hypothetical protein H7A26_06000 [Spirochaetales bacterium]|nr:hypothetical protein [Spirochaetales bacterium]
MIFANFLVVLFILLISAHFCGDVGSFINIDSAVIVAAGFIFSSIALSAGRFKLFLRGLGEVFSFSSNRDPSREIKNLFFGISVMTMGVGLCSTAQGFFSGTLIKSAYSISEIIVFSSFTTIYSFILVVFLLLPVSFRNMIK